MITVETTPYLGWAECLKLTNGHLELIVTLEVGPRIIHCGLTGQKNLFCKFPEVGQTGGEEFAIYGGHRFWLAPEHPVRTYQPDNQPVTWQPRAEGAVILGPVDAYTGMQKEITLALAVDRPVVQVSHRLINRLPWGVQVAPWALSVMAPGGIGILPLPPRGSHEENLLPTTSLALWSYTDFSDPRWQFGSEYILLKQDSSRSTPQKVGLHGQVEWAAYWLDDHLFIKQIEFEPHASYPDLNSHIELFTNHEMLEVETLGPLREIAAGESITHTETWSVFDGIPRPDNDQIINRTVRPLLQQ
ncbi:MAG: hypothetical protein QNJ45_07060 [Ardenticatenaceae bacterium]|nr:hypothetical protein [Ardenticatenaceae bacterium]